MPLMLDAFWRALAYCVHPRVIALSLLPLLLIVALCWGLGYLFWDAALDAVNQTLSSYELLSSFWSWLDGMGMGALKAALAPLIVIFAVTPLIVFGTLLVVAVLMMPALVSLVADRRFPKLERKKGASLLTSIGWSLLSMLLAALALVVSLPLWLVPPLVLVVPPLIWGWLTYRVMAFDALAEHASAEERQQIFRQHRSWLLGMGLASGLMGAAPSAVWASGALFAAAFVILIPLAIWIYTLVFAFSALWFAHYTLAALVRLRDAAPAPDGDVVDMPALASAGLPVAPLASGASGDAPRGPPG